MTKLTWDLAYSRFDCIYRFTHMWVKLGLLPQGSSEEFNTACSDFVRKHAVQ